MGHKAMKSSILFASLCSALILGACVSYAPSNVPKTSLEGTPLDRNAISVTKRTEFLEIKIDPQAAKMSDTDLKRIENFVVAYRDHGHGQLILSLPEGGVNRQYAMDALTEARAIAWENGVEYEELAGTSHDVAPSDDTTLILAFQAYDAVAPKCQPLSHYDIGDFSNNNELENFGCAVNTNIAAMIADPADLLGQRALEGGDPVRRQVIMDLFRQGKSTGTERAGNESGAVSSAVN